MIRIRIPLMTGMLIAALAGCSATGPTTDGDPITSGADGATAGRDQVYDTRDISDTYGYDPGAAPDGRIIGGPQGDRRQRTVYFAFDSARIDPDSRPVVQAQARYLLDHPRVMTVLEGHADERGTREYNIGLGDRRANAVRQLLIASGVGTDQIRTVSYGEERPAVDGNDETSYALNRRVEFTY